nr:reverse transcriptase domain-containing protein [Tanacetum cinerariifolium]
VWFDDLPPESIDSYNDLKKAFLENYLQQKNYIKDPIELHNIKQRDGESTEDFIRKYKLERRDVKGAPECMSIFGFVHGITNPELIKRLHAKILKTVAEMMRVTTSFLMGKVAASNHDRKKTFPPWKQHESSQKVWFDDLPPESIDSYNDLKKAFLENYLQQKNYIKDPIELHNIKQWDGESTEDFIRKYKLERRDVKGAPECMSIFGFVHGITNPELIKRLHAKILKTVAEMMRVTTSFLRGKVAASNHDRKNTFPPWKQHESSQKQNFKKGDKGKFKAPPPMTTPVEKRNHAKFCEFHGEVWHNTDECMHLRKQIEEMLKAGKLSHLIKEIKQNNEKEQPKETKKGETSRKDKALAILMSSYNGIIGRPGVKKLQAIPSTAHGMLKIPVEGERNLDIFAWKPLDMTGVPRHIAKHRLNVREGCSPVRQKKRGQAANGNQAIQEEVGKLVGAGTIREVHYHDWLSIPVMVKNMTAVGGYAYKGYHQIQMATEDEDKTAFITSQVIFCYTKIPFSLRNAGATYQRLVDKAFHKQIDRNLEVYVDTRHKKPYGRRDSQGRRRDI